MLQEVYVGKEEGLRIAKEYCYYVEEKGQYQCKLCPYISRGQAVENHVLAKHLTKLYLYRLTSKYDRNWCYICIYFSLVDPDPPRKQLP